MFDNLIQAWRSFTHKRKPIIEQEFALSRQIILDQSEVIPRFTLFTGTEKLVLMIQLSDDEKQRTRALALVRCLMVHRQIDGFCFSGEAIAPPALSLTYISRDRCFSAYQLIEKINGKKPPDNFIFSKICYLQDVDPVIEALLPAPTEKLTVEETKLAKKIELDCQISKADLTIH